MAQGWSKAGFQAKLLRQAFDHHDFTNNDVDSARIDVNDPKGAEAQFLEGIRTKFFHRAKGETGRARYVISGYVLQVISELR